MSLEERSVLDTDWLCGACGTDRNEEIVRCDDCGDWFHTACVGVTAPSVQNIVWLCPKHRNSLANGLTRTPTHEQNNIMQNENSIMVQQGISTVHPAIQNANNIGSAEDFRMYNNGGQRSTSAINSTIQNVNQRTTDSYNMIDSSFGQHQTSVANDSENILTNQTDANVIKERQHNNKSYSSRSSTTSSSSSRSSVYYRNLIKELEEKHNNQIQSLTAKFEQMLVQQRDQNSASKLHQCTNTVQHQQTSQCPEQMHRIEKIQKPSRQTDPFQHPNYTSRQVYRQQNECTSEDKTKKWINMNNTIPPVNMDYIAKMTADRIEARKSIPLKLPNFSGDPKDYPMFISAYETSTNELNLSNAQNLIRLREHLKGEAFKVVEDLLQFPESVPEAIKTLKRLYGRPDIIIKSILEKIKLMPLPNLNDMKTFIIFAATVKSMVTRMKETHMEDYASNRMLFSEVLYRLPKDIQLDWSRYKRRNNEESNLAALSDFLEYLADDVSEVIDITQQKLSQNRHGVTIKHNIRSKNVNAIEVKSNQAIQKEVSKDQPCVVCADIIGHDVENCEKFNAMTNKERWEAVIKNRL